METTRKVGKVIVKVLWTLMLCLIALDGAHHIASRVSAQGISAGGGRGTNGLRRLGNEFFFETPSGTVASTRFGVYFEGQTEPTQVDQSGSWWAYVSGPANSLSVEIKVNIVGNVLVIHRDKWSLPSQ